MIGVAGADRARTARFRKLRSDTVFCPRRCRQLPIRPGCRGRRQVHPNRQPRSGETDGQEDQTAKRSSRSGSAGRTQRPRGLFTSWARSVRRIRHRRADERALYRLMHAVFRMWRPSIHAAIGHVVMRQERPGTPSPTTQPIVGCPGPCLRSLGKNEPGQPTVSTVSTGWTIGQPMPTS